MTAATPIEVSPALEAAGFPCDPETDYVEVKGTLLRELFEGVERACNGCVTRHNLTYVRVEREGEILIAVATDGHRLHVERFEGPDADVVPIAEGRPLHLSPEDRKALQKTLRGGKRCPRARIRLAGKGYHVRCRDRECVVGMEDLTFPDWRVVVKPAGDTVPILSPETATAIVEGCRELSGVFDGVDLKREGDLLKVTAERDLPGAEGSVLRAQMIHQCCGSGPLEVLVSPNYLADALEFIGGEVRITVADNLGPIRLDCGNGRSAHVMPRRKR
jgi:DNA polymerase III sliding clamp (beta) subunit (PCNA family)